MDTIVQRAKLNDLGSKACLRGTLTTIADGQPISQMGEPVPWRSVPVSPAESD